MARRMQGLAVALVLIITGGLIMTILLPAITNNSFPLTRANVKLAVQSQLDRLSKSKIRRILPYFGFRNLTANGFLDGGSVSKLAGNATGKVQGPLARNEANQLVFATNLPIPIPSPLQNYKTTAPILHIEITKEDQRRVRGLGMDRGKIDLDESCSAEGEDVPWPFYKVG